MPIETNQQQSAPPAAGLNPRATLFNPTAPVFNPVAAAPPQAPKKDLVALNLKKLNQSDEEITNFKQVLETAQKDKERRGTKPIDIDLFLQIAKLNLCQATPETVDQFDHCVNVHIVTREVSDTIKAKSNKQNYNK